MNEIDEILQYLQMQFPDRNMWGQGEYDNDELIALWKRGNKYLNELNQAKELISKLESENEELHQVYSDNVKFRKKIKELKERLNE